MEYIGEIAALGAAIFWSGTSIAFTEASRKIGSFQLNVNRLVLALIVIMIALAIGGITIQFTPNQIILLGISGFAGLVFGDSFLFKAFQYLGARIGMLLLSLSPVMAAGIGYLFLGEELALISITGIALTVGGVAFVVLDRKETAKETGGINYKGIIFGILGALGQASGLALAKAAFNDGQLHPLAANSLRMLAAIIIIYPGALIIGKLRNPVKTFAGKKNAFLLMLTGVILGPFIGITLSLIAVEHTKVGIASTLSSTMPVIMLPMVRYYYKEKIKWKAIAGAIAAVTGIALLFLT